MSLVPKGVCRGISHIEWIYVKYIYICLEMHHVLPQTDPQNSFSNNIQGMTCRAPLAGFSGHSSNQIHSSPLFEPKNGAQPLRAHMFPYNSGEEPWDRRDTGGVSGGPSLCPSESSAQRESTCSASQTLKGRANREPEHQRAAW